MTESMKSTSPSDVATLAREASERIYDIVARTDLEYSAAFSELCGTDVYLKLENRQRTGSFKLRGATNCLLTLDADVAKRGCVVASSGNHGAAVAYAMQKLGIQGQIFVPEQTSSVKVDAIQRHGGCVEKFGTDGLDTEQHARAYAETNEMFYLSPYNDPQVIAGQGSIGVELLEQIPDMSTLYIAVGGGGLISGIASVVKSVRPDIQVIGCQPAASAVMAKSVEAGRLLDIPSDRTLSDGTAGGVEQDAVTFGLCNDLVDEFVLVSEDEIGEAMREFIDYEHQLIEGAAGVALAAMKKHATADCGKVVTVICGANVSRQTLAAVIGTEP